MAADREGANPMWGGHFAQGPAEAFAAINPSIAVDQRLYAEDIAGSIVHATMLAHTGILTQDEAQAIIGGLLSIEQEIKRGEFIFTPALEDIHMHIEARLSELIGPVAGKLHTARSRNDQVATDLRLFARTQAAEMGAAVGALQQALLTQAQAHVDTLLPGLTHLQPAQPISFAHHLLAYGEMLWRDRGRIADAAARLNECPLGAAALAGTTYPIDRELTADALGFSGPMRNSLDAVASRDFVLELLSAYAICATHLSRLAEEMIFWSSPLLGFVCFSEAFTSGSSIMPQKRNPDAAELVRGKAGGIIGALMQMLTVLKALPLAYNKDLQEDKKPFFTAGDELRLCLLAMTGMVADMQPQVATMRAACAQGYLNATDLADWLVSALGMPFRQAHHVTGKIVRRAEELAMPLENMPLSELQAIHPEITPALFGAIGLEGCVARRASLGGTAPVRVRAAIAEATSRWQAAR